MCNGANPYLLPNLKCYSIERRERRRWADARVVFWHLLIVSPSPLAVTI